MKPSDQLSFAVSDRIDDIEVSPSRVPLSLLGEFHNDVAEFLRGSTREVKTNEVFVSIEPGSVKFIASGLMAVTTLWADVSVIESSKSISSIDRSRAEVIERWQQRSIKNPNRAYYLSDANGNLLIKITSETDYKVDRDVWLNVEKYLLGTVTDMGGLNRPNIHFSLQDGTPLVISADKSKIAGEHKNWIYHDAVLRVVAEENLITGDLKNIRLLGFENYEPNYNEDDFREMTARGRDAWEDVQDATAWVEHIRGNN